MAGELVGVADRSASTRNRRGLQAGLSLAREIGCHRLGRGRERGDAAAKAECLEAGEVSPVSLARGRSLVLPREGGSTVEVCGRKGGQRPDLVDDDGRK